MMRPLNPQSMLQQQYQGADPEALEQLMMEPERGDPDELGEPEEIPTVAPQKPEDDVLDYNQADILAQLHLETMKEYALVSENAQWKASDLATR